MRKILQAMLDLTDEEMTEAEKRYAEQQAEVRAEREHKPAPAPYEPPTVKVGQLVYSQAIAVRTSGLSVSSCGNGTNSASVVHAYVQADYERGRLKRKKGQYLCRKNWQPWDTTFWPAENDNAITCPACRKHLERAAEDEHVRLAERFEELNAVDRSELEPWDDVAWEQAVESLSEAEHDLRWNVATQAQRRAWIEQEEAALAELEAMADAARY